jgi:electron transport complex protein RnfD
MARKLMIMPSARSRYVKDDNMKLILLSLIVVAVFMVISNSWMFSFMHAAKQVTMIVLSVIVTREVEIFFYTLDKGIDRATSKELIVKSYPYITGLTYALLIPIGTPIWLVVIGAVMATFLGKLMFGGFHHMVFYSPLVGYLFVTLGWTGLATNEVFVNSFDTFIFELIFDNKFFNEILSIGSVYTPGAGSALSQIMAGTSYELLDLFLGLTPGIVGNGAVLLAVFVFLLVKKAINWVTPVTLLGSFLITAFVIGLAQEQSITFALEHLFSGAFLFVLVFAVTDYITTPIPTLGKVIYGVIAGALAMFIRIGGTYEEGIIFAVLFMSMLTPLLNTELKKKKKDLMPKKAKKKATPEKVGA